jgi:hypothetical protein
MRGKRRARNGIEAATRETASGRAARRDVAALILPLPLTVASPDANGQRPENIRFSVRGLTQTIQNEHDLGPKCIGPLEMPSSSYMEDVDAKHTNGLYFLRCFVGRKAPGNRHLQLRSTAAACLSLPGFPVVGFADDPTTEKAIIVFCLPTSLGSRGN